MIIVLNGTSNFYEIRKVGAKRGYEFIVSFINILFFFNNFLGNVLVHVNER